MLKFQIRNYIWFLIQFKNLLNLHEKSPRLATASSAPGSPLSKHIQHITMSHFTLTSNRAYSISISTVGAFNRRSTHRYISISHISLKFTFFLCRCCIIVVKSHLDEHKTNWLIHWLTKLRFFAPRSLLPNLYSSRAHRISFCRCLIAFYFYVSRKNAIILHACVKRSESDRRWIYKFYLEPSRVSRFCVVWFADETLSRGEEKSCFRPPSARLLSLTVA